MTFLTELLVAPTAATAAAVGFFGIAAFQVALAVGAPLGRAAWGGGRIACRRACGSRARARSWFLLAATIVLGRAAIQISPLPPAVLRWGTLILVALLPLGAIMNLASSSPWDRFLWGPLALALALLTFVVAVS